MPERLPPDTETVQDIEQILQTQLLERYGPTLSGRDLSQALGFPSPTAFRQAALRGRLPVPVFQVPHRRGRFALTHEVAAWLGKCRQAQGDEPLGPAQPGTPVGGKSP